MVYLGPYMFEVACEPMLFVLMLRNMMVRSKKINLTWSDLSHQNTHTQERGIIVDVTWNVDKGRTAVQLCWGFGSLKQYFIVFLGQGSALGLRVKYLILK